MGPPAGNGVLLNDGNVENAYGTLPSGRVGVPVKAVAVPSASRALPCGMEPIRKMSCSPGPAVSGG